MIARLRNPRGGDQGWLRLPERTTADPVVKPLPYLPIYEKLLAPLRDETFALLELGVWSGDSLEMWRDAFPRATIVGVDLGPPDLQLGPRVHVVRGDQSDADLMRRLRTEYAPAGFDVIVDDASHIGVITARSLQALYAEHLRPGGLYCIEDWGTGYLPDWEDGQRLASQLDVGNLDATATPKVDEGSVPTTMPSHDAGVVGVIKRLIDHAASGSVRLGQSDLVGDVLAIESMTVWDGVVAIRKPKTSSE